MIDLSRYPTDDQLSKLMLKLHELGRETDVGEAIILSVQLGDLLGISAREGADIFLRSSDVFKLVKLVLGHLKYLKLDGVIDEERY